MKLRRRPAPSAEPQLSRATLSAYADFCYAITALTTSDAEQLAGHFASLRGRRWYEKAVTAAWDAAYDSGRIDGNDMVVGADEDQADLLHLSLTINYCGALDVAVAILVSDLIPADTYRQLTSWWAKAESAYLPEKPATESPAPLPEPGPPATEPARVTPVEMIPPPRRQHRPADTAPLLVDTEIVTRRARDRVANRANRRTRAAAANATGIAMIIAAFVAAGAGSLCASAYSSTFEQFLLMTAAGLALAVFCVVAAVLAFRRGDTIRKERI